MEFTVSSWDRDVDPRSTSLGASSAVRARCNGDEEECIVRC